MANIVQRIALEGAEAVVRSLQAMGVAGQQSARAIQTAMNSVAFDRFTTQIRNAGNNLRELGARTTDLAGRLTGIFGITITAGAVGFAGSLLQVARAGTEAADAIDDLASDIGSTIGEVQALQSVFVQTGVAIEGLSERFRRLAVTSEATWKEIRDSVRDAADVIKRDQIGLQEASIGLAQSQMNLRRAFRDAAAAAGDPAKTEQALLNLRSAQLGVDKALIASSEAKRKATDDEANSVATLAGYVRAVSQGGEYLNNVNRTAENALKGIVAAAGQTSGALQKIEGDFFGLAARSGPKLNAVVFQMADFFKGLKDESFKTAVAVQAFGRGIDHDMIEALSKGSAAFRAQEAELERLGLKFEETDTAVANTFKSSYNKLVSYISLIRDRIGIEIAPAAEQLVRVLTTIVTENIGRIRELAQQAAAFIRNTLTPAVQAFANVVSGVKFDDWSQSAAAVELTLDQLFAVNVWQQRFENIKTAAQNTFTGIGKIISGIVAVLNTVAAAINVIANTNISGADIGLVLLLAQLTGINTILLTIIATFTSLVRVVAAAVAVVGGWPALLIAAFIALIAIIWNYRDEIKAGIRTIIDTIVEVFDFLVSYVTSKLTELGQMFTGFVQGVLAGVGKIAQALKSAGLSFLRGDLGAVLGGGAPAGQAGGGMIHGPGTGTSDSILARVSTGEYVVRAAAVRHWGTSFLHAVNAAPGFAIGGLVETLRSALSPLQAPRLAAGGPVAGGAGGGLRPFTLVMPNGASYGGLYAEGGTVTQLRRAAVHAQVSSTGRRPSWVR